MGLGRRALGFALWVGALLGLLAVLAGTAVMFFGCNFLVFRSGSMSPGIPTGSMALARTVPASQLRTGDIVSVVASDGKRITHRIVSTTPHGDTTSLVLKGDANSTPDAEVYVVRAAPRVVVAVPWAGYAAAYLLSPIGLIVAACLSGALVIVAFTGEAPEEDPTPHHRGKRGHRVVAGAVGAAVVVGSAGAADGVTGTMAAYTDKATVTSGAFTADKIVKTTSISCAPTGQTNGTMTISVPVNDARYDYVLRIYNAANTAMASTTDFAMTEAGGTASKGFTPNTAATAVGSTSGTYTVRVYSHVGTLWESPGYRSYTFTLGTFIIIPTLACGTAGTAGT